MRTEHRRGAAARVPGAPPWWLVAAAVLVLVLTALDVAHHGELTHLDSSISERVRSFGIPQHGVLAHCLFVLILPGQRGVVLPVSAALIVYLTWRARTLEFAARWLLALLAMTAFVYAFKWSVHRAAPTYLPGKANPADSFPSGHLANALLMWALLAWCAVRAAAPARLRWALQAVRAVGPVTVFAGMTLLDYHWLSDFIGGACIALILLPLVLHPRLGPPARRFDAMFWRRPPVAA